MDSLDIIRLFNLKGKIALVTGGSRGIGRMIAQGFLQAGATVYIAARKQGPCEQTKQELSQYGSCTSIAADIGTAEGRSQLIEKLSKHESRLSILVNNAGTVWGARLDEYPDNGFSKVMNLNVNALFALSRDLAPMLAKGASFEDPARIINIGSIDGLHIPTVARVGTYAYTASKAAVHHLTRHLAIALAPKHITVNAIAPGFYPSKMTDASISKYRKDIEHNCPMKRIGKPEEMAGIAVYLCSLAGAYTNGAVIPVDGGTSINHEHVHTTID